MCLSFISGTPHIHTPTGLADLKRQFHFSSDCTPRKQDENEIKKNDSCRLDSTSRKLRSPSRSPNGSQLVYHSPKGDVSSDFDVSISSDAGHESGIHPLPVYPSRDNSLDDIKEEVSSELKSSDASNISTSSPKKDSAVNSDLNFIPGPHSPVTVSADIQLNSKRDFHMTVHDHITKHETDYNHHNSKTDREGYGYLETQDGTAAVKMRLNSSDSEDLLEPIIRKRVRISTEYSDVFPEEMSFDETDSGDVFEVGAPKQSPSLAEPEDPDMKGVAKCHPRLRALSQLTHHMSPVGNLSSLSTMSGTVFSADIATSSPIPTNSGTDEGTDSCPTKFAECQELHECRLPQSSSARHVDLSGREAFSAELISMLSDFPSLQEENSTYGPKESTKLEECISLCKGNNSSITTCHDSENFKIPSQARGIKRPFGSNNASPPTDLVRTTHSTGLTKNFGALQVVSPATKRLNLKKSPCSRMGIKFRQDHSNESRSSDVNEESRYVFSLHFSMLYILF